MKAERRMVGRKTARILVSLLILAFFLYPLLWAVVTSFKPKEIIIKTWIWQFTPTIEHYTRVITDSDYAFVGWYRNSLVVSLTCTALGVFVGSLGAYALTRFKFYGKNSIGFFILSVRFAAPIAALIPLFTMFYFFNLLDTLYGLIMVDLMVILPFVIWMARGFFEEIPVEIEEAALVDGCSRLRAFFTITLPLARTGLAATAILAFIFVWNEFLFATTFTGVGARTAPLAVFNYIGQYIGGINWGPLLAAGILTTLPVIVFAMFVQKYIIRGLTFGAVKG